MAAVRSRVFIYDKDPRSDMGDGVTLHDPERIEEYQELFRSIVYAADEGNFKECQEFIRIGAPLNGQYFGEIGGKAVPGHSPLHRAALKGHDKVVELLIASKAQVNADHITCARAAGHHQIVQTLEASANVKVDPTKVKLATARFTVSESMFDLSEDAVVAALKWESLRSFEDRDAYVVLNDKPAEEGYELLIVSKSRYLKNGFTVRVFTLFEKPNVTTMAEAMEKYSDVRGKPNFRPFTVGQPAARRAAAPIADPFFGSFVRDASSALFALLEQAQAAPRAHASASAPQAAAGQTPLPKAEFLVFFGEEDYSEKDIVELLEWQSLRNFKNGDAYVVSSGYSLILVWKNADGFQFKVAKPHKIQADTMQEAFGKYFMNVKDKLNFLPFKA